MEREFGPNLFERLAKGSEARRAMIEANLGVWTSRVGPLNDQQEPFFWMHFVPGWARPALYGGVTLAGLAGAACFGGGGPKPKPEQPPDVGDNVPKVERPIDKPEAEPLNPNGFLDWPHAKHPDMKHVQGWIYSGKEVPDGREHGANDYVLGTDPNLASTWKKFPVLAAADGSACQESFDTNLGRNYAVRVRHPNKYETRNLHMDPTSISEAQIPTCTSDKTNGKAVKRGDKLGQASDTGTERGWNHNHFEVFDPSGQAVDPYDIYGKRDKYPDPNLTNGIPCGPRALWINCPTGAVLGARTAAPVATVTPRLTLTPEPVPTPEQKKRGFPDPYSAALDWYTKKWDINPEALDCKSVLKFCFQEATRNANVVVYNGGRVGSGGGYLLFVGQEADASWRAVYSPDRYNEFFPPLPKTTLLVQGTDSCLNVRSTPSLSGDRLACVPDRIRVTIDQGPIFADGYIWVHLKSYGWSVVNYLGGCDPQSVLC